MKTRLALYPGVALIAMLFTSCSGIGRAVVTDVDGQPCFSIPQNWDTRNGLDLYDLSVSQNNGPEAEKPYEDVWRFSVEPPGSSIIARPGNCFLYGVTPARATQTVHQPLELYRVYHVFLHARPDNSPLRGYDAEFCVKPTANGKTMVQHVMWDEKAGRRRYDLCERPLVNAATATDKD